MPTFRNTLFHLRRQVGAECTYLPTKMGQTEYSETSAHKIQTPGNYPEESIQQDLICPLPLRNSVNWGLKFVYTLRKSQVWWSNNRNNNNNLKGVIISKGLKSWVVSGFRCIFVPTILIFFVPSVKLEFKIQGKFTLSESTYMPKVVRRLTPPGCRWDFRTGRRMYEECTFSSF